MLKIIKLSLSLFLILLISSCRKECIIDECKDKKATANFFMRETISGFPDGELLPDFCDTLLSNAARFIAEMPNAMSYEWQIGADTRIFYGKELKLGFSQYLGDINNVEPNGKYYKPIVITLKVKNKLSKCIKDSVLEFKKNLTFVNSLRQPFWTGKFVGYYSEDNNLDTIEIDWINTSRVFQPNRYPGKALVFIGFRNLNNRDTCFLMEFPEPTDGKYLRSFKQIKWDLGTLHFRKTVFPWHQPNYDGFNMGDICILTPTNVLGN
jgi:hypothetical protein